MRHKRPFYQAMQELQKLYMDLDGAGDALQMQFVVALERQRRIMEDLHTSTLDGAEGFERCRHGNELYRNPMQPTAQELKEEDEFYRRLKEEPEQEEIEDDE